jgi:hypothetical protein
MQPTCWGIYGIGLKMTWIWRRGHPLAGVFNRLWRHWAFKGYSILRNSFQFEIWVTIPNLKLIVVVNVLSARQSFFQYVTFFFIGTKYDDMALDILSEFMNSVAGQAITSWDHMGLSADFGIPRITTNVFLDDSDFENTSIYEVMLNVG